MSKKFFRQVIQIEVLSEDVPLEWSELADIDYAINHGDCSGKIEEISSEQVTPQQMAKLLIAQNSEPDFFNLGE